MKAGPGEGGHMWTLMCEPFSTWLCLAVEQRGPEWDVMIGLKAEEGRSAHVSVFKVLSNSGLKSAEVTSCFSDV